MPNIFEPEFDAPREHPGFESRRAWIGRQAGAERLAASLWELPPGQANAPYHFHYVQEELLFVLAGQPSLRTPDGWRVLEPGEVVDFAAGERGAHQLTNRTAESVRLLIFSLGGVPEICVYPDSDKIGVYEGRAEGGGLAKVFRRSDAVELFDGESRGEGPAGG
ncbi:MAG: hypothetical protein QOH12_1972 [Solirubrobacteraceae bacterium]|jgi:uncharacterized cupin superfamily protein|nr:hypothetical protein [Solirubrobacteraceae bacterium]